MVSDMHCFLLDEWAQFGAQSFFRHQIDRTSEQIFEMELDAEVAFRSRRTVEGDQNIDIAVAPGTA